MNQFENDPKSFGITIDKPDSHNGQISVTYDWEAVEKYSMEWARWFHNESHDLAAREIAEHLDNAAKSMVKTIAAG